MIGRGFVKVSVTGHLKELLTHPDFFGELSLTDSGGSPSTVTTITLCQFMLLTREEFEEVLELYPSMKKALFRYAANKEKAARNTASAMNSALDHLLAVKLELQQHRHLLSKEGVKRLTEEISNLESEKNTTLRTSLTDTPKDRPGGGDRKVRPGSEADMAPVVPGANGGGAGPGGRRKGPKCM